MKLPKNPFLKIGEFLVEKMGPDRLEKRNREISQELVSLATGNRDAIPRHYAEKIADTLLVLTVLSAVSLLVFLTMDRNSLIVENNRLERPGYGMGDREEELVVQMEGETETEVIAVTVQERKLTGQQAEELLERARETVASELRGNNFSLDEVRDDLKFSTSLENGLVTVNWMTFPYGIVEEDGRITGTPEEEGSLVEIRATLSCQGMDLVYETAACVYPQLLTEEERLWKSVKEEVAKADEAGANQEMLTLPHEVEGRKLTWLHQREDILPLFLALMVILPCCVYIWKDQKVHERAKARKMQLMMDYPELMWKMTMLLGAGLTIRGMFHRITSEYRKENSGELHYVYEEMLYTCHEMKSGVPEGTAYENFGRRCQLPKYIKLGSLLSQNLKKGSKGLVSLLEKEAQSSMEERRSVARKLGEQAGTKLMFPMILMFGIVLIVLIVPAFLSF